MPDPSPFSIFGPEALRAWHLWAGASLPEAAQAARGQGGPAWWMPQDPETGARATPERFIDHLDGFAAAHGLGAEWAAPEIPMLDLPALPGRGQAEAGAGKAIVIGLTGERGAGKSVVGTHLVEDHGFLRCHPFNPGKALLRAYYIARGADADTAMAMTDGALKNSPSPLLPLDPATGLHHSSRWLMERMGNYMATRMGVAWTIGVEMRRQDMLAAATGAAAPPMLIESVVYEEPVVRAWPQGRIARIVLTDAVRQGQEAAGEITDSFVDRVNADFTIVNNMDGVARLIEDFDAAALAAGLDYGQEWSGPLEP